MRTEEYVLLGWIIAIVLNAYRQNVAHILETINTPFHMKTKICIIHFSL